MRRLFKNSELYAAILIWIASYSSLCYGSSEGEKSASGSNTAAQSQTVLNIGSRLELFVDDYLIERLSGDAELRLHNPVPQEIVFVHDKPWEGSGSGYHSIFKDGDKYRMYYKAWQHEASQTKTHGIYCCYAESNDGIHWTRPELGLYEFEGSNANNIVFINGEMKGADADGGHPAVFRDENPNVSPDALYKALLPANKTRGLIAFKSPDGINWTPIKTTPVITDGAFDSQNLGFWDNVLGEYRAYWRYFDGGTKENPFHGVRSIRTAKSKDFINWYDQADLKYVDSPEEQLYTNQVKPYYRAPHILIGFPMRYIDRGWSESMKALPELEHREWRSAISQRYGTAITDALFMASRDGVLFKRWNEAFMRPGIERKGTWNYGHHCLAWTIVETKSALGGGAPDELSFYSVESYWTDNSSELRRYTLRIDGFVSVNAPMKGGELITRPFTFTGKNLFLNFSSSAAGDIHIEIQDAMGKPVSGFSLEDSPPVFGDAIERRVPWKNGSDLSKLEGKTIRLRFVIRDADIFSLQFK
jgi:hypothetical protein